MNWVIYTLADPRTGHVRYVGWTVNLARRVRDHQKPSQLAKGQRRDKWILSLKQAGLTPLVSVIEEGAGDGWADAERKWIAHYRATSDVELTNHTDGGQGTPGRRPSPETRARWSEIRKGRPPAPLSIQRTSELHKGVPLGPEHRQKIAVALKGKIRSPAHREAIAASSRGRPRTPAEQAALDRLHALTRQRNEAKRHG